MTESYAGETDKVAGVVTARAIQRRRHMIDRLTGADPAVVARRAVGGIDAHVIKGRTSEVRGVMAHRAILGRGQVIDELANSDHVVMARLAVIDDTGMVICARGKGARRVTSTAILERRHVVNRFAVRRDAMAGAAIVHDAGVIDECVGEIIGVVAHAAVFDSYRVGRNCGGLTGRIYAVVVIVA